MIELPARRVPVFDGGDVVVVGGGTAGFIAAVAAARLGARVLLLERFGYLAGALCGTYACEPGYFGDSEGQQIIAGIGWEFIERMERAGAAVVDREWWTVQLFPEAAKGVALEMVVEAGVELYLYTWAGEPIMDGRVIEGVVAHNKSGWVCFRGRAFVDASGDADLAHAAGAPTEKLPAEQLWQTSVDLTLCNIDAARVAEWARAHPERATIQTIPPDVGAPGIHPMLTLVLRGSEAGGRRGFEHVGPMPTVKLMIHPSVGRVQGSVEIDGTEARDLTYAEIEARRRAMAHLAYLRETVAGFEHAIVVGESPLGVRETRRIVGEYVLTLSDLHNNARFPDVVALNGRALDRHLKGDVFQLELLAGNHDIPLRALLPKGVDNLMVAGRCISSDHEANASLRGAATCMATGHAAGAAAALVAAAGAPARQVAMPALQATLKRQGAILSAV